MEELGWGSVGSSLVADLPLGGPVLKKIGRGEKQDRKAKALEWRGPLSLKIS